MKNTPTEIKRDAAGFKARMKIKLSRMDKIAEFLTTSFGTVWFFNFNAILFVVWIVLNTNIIPGFKAFDPFPFGLLTMIVSLEAIFLSIIVLISQNRESHIADIREETDFEINVQAEDEITRILNLVDDIHGHLGLSGEDDAELTRMKQKINVEKIGQQILEDE